MKELILATNNAGKIKELKLLLSPIQCISQSSLNIPEAVENGLSFIENALIKARHASILSGKPALADDSGLVVPALKGEPGIYSARYAGTHANTEDNMDLLLKNMEHLSGEQRKAFFYCAIALVSSAEDPTPIITTGKLEGYIALERTGEKGFGYDPLFYLFEYQCTMAQLSIELKNNISHRAQALTQLTENLRKEKKV